MRLWLRAFLWVLIVSAIHPHAYAQQADPLVVRQAEKLRDQAMAGTQAYDIVRDLTTLFGPRFGGSEAEKKSADWAANKLKSMGFANVRIEEFAIDTWVRGIETGVLISPAPQPIVLTALGYSVATPPDGLEAEVALFKTYDEMLAAPAGSLAGKIALVTQRTIKVQDGAGYGATGPIRRSGASEAAKRGAVAYLLRSLGTSTNRFAHTGSMRYDPDQPKIPAAAISAPDAEQIERLAALGKPIRMKITITPRLTGPGISRNVIADIPGTDKADEVVIIGGHLDSWDQGTGALDDGAGVAITTAAAKLILDGGMKPRRTIRLILFGSEEIGLLGARAYVAANTKDIGKHVIGAESDFGAGPVYQFSTRIAPSALWAARAIGDVLRPLGIDPGDNMTTGGPDLTPFLAQGMPVAELQQDGRDYFDYHHTPNDTIERVDAKALDQNVAAYAVFAFMAASLDVDFRGGKASILEK